MAPEELESSTENDSRRLCSSAGGIFESGSAWSRADGGGVVLAVVRAKSLDRDAGLLYASECDETGLGGSGSLRDGDGGGSVCALMKDVGFLEDLVGVLAMSSSSSSSSETVYDCLSFDGDVIGDAPRCEGGVDGRSLTWVGDCGEAGLRKGEDRGELRNVDWAESTITYC